MSIHHRKKEAEHTVHLAFAIRESDIDASPHRWGRQYDLHLQKLGFDVLDKLDRRFVPRIIAGDHAHHDAIIKLGSDHLLDVEDVFLGVAGNEDTLSLTDRGNQFYYKGLPISEEPHNPLGGRSWRVQNNTAIRFPITWPHQPHRLNRQQPKVGVERVHGLRVRDFVLHRVEASFETRAVLDRFAEQML